VKPKLRGIESVRACLSRRITSALVIGVALLVAVACSAPIESQTSKIYLYRVPGPGALAGSFEGLIPVARKLSAADASTTISALLEGPTAEEQAAGITSAVPSGTTLRSVDIGSGIATIDLSATFDDGGGSMSMFVRLTQLVYTATQFPGVTGVKIELDGEPVTTFSSEGIELLNPMRRGDSLDQLPALFIDAPAWGATAQSPLQVSGMANVFEAQFRIELLDSRGNSLADATAMATCGTGCWGEFSELIVYSVAETQWGTLRVYEPSAKDGSPINVAEYRVQLTPTENP